MFQVNPDSIIHLASKPEGAATFSSTSLKIRFAEIEVNNGGTIEIAKNVALLFTDPANLMFTLVPWFPLD